MIKIILPFSDTKSDIRIIPAAEEINSVEQACCSVFDTCMHVLFILLTNYKSVGFCSSHWERPGFRDIFFFLSRTVCVHKRNLHFSLFFCCVADICSSVESDHSQSPRTSSQLGSKRRNGADQQTLQEHP